MRRTKLPSDPWGVRGRTVVRSKKRDIVLPAESAGGMRTTVRVRYVTEPEAEQKTLLQRLGLTLPRRLKRLDGTEHME